MLAGDALSAERGGGRHVTQRARNLVHKKDVFFSEHSHMYIHSKPTLNREYTVSRR